jgi:hypothetical protein
MAAVSLAVVVLPGGCGAQAVVATGGDSEAPSPALVLKAAYELEGQQRQVVFVDAVELADDEFDALMAELEAELQVEVLPAEAAFRGDPDLPALTPIDPETGEVGVSLTLHEIAEVAAREYEAVVSYARSGLDGGELIIVLARDAAGWAVVEHVTGSQS